jgi:hypothetical protein
MKIWGKNYSKFTTPQLCPFQKLLQILLSFKLRSFSIKFAKLEGDLQPILKSLGQFLFTKNIYKQLQNAIYF